MRKQFSYGFVLSLLLLFEIVGCGSRLPENTSELKSLTVAEAVELVARKKNLLLDGLTSLPPDVAGALAEQSQGLLFLRGLTELSTASAEKLTSQKQGTIFLQGITSLSPQLAVALSGHQGTLVLSGLKTVTPETAEILVKHEGKLYLRHLERELVEDDAATILRENEDITLPEWVFEVPKPRRRRRQQR